MLKYALGLFILISLHNGGFAQKAVPINAQTVPIDGNTWGLKNGESFGESISKQGIQRWTNEEVLFKTFFRVTKPGDVEVWLNAEAVKGKSTLEVTINNSSKKVNLSKTHLSDVYVGKWNLADTGYVSIETKGLSKEGAEFARIADIKLAGSAINDGTRYVKNNDGNFFYWGRRGPSVHLAYQVPNELEVEYYYNEITVPDGEDVIGSYYMANGFSGGYFGIQVNSETERRVLFSVWSPYVTDNPKEIPEEERIKLLKKGEGVYTGEFGNEGSGGQSYLRYNWKSGNTYKFLLKGTPVKDNYTEYTAWFFAPEENEWKLIASFSRPKTHSYLKGFHSFLENFSPNQGIYERKVLFDNQWVVDSKGNWREMNRARFTADNTARSGFRMDYAGGVTDNGVFYLRNCGFFSDYTPVDLFFERRFTNQKPTIDLSKLP